MSIDPSGLPIEYASAMATVVGIYAIAVVGTSLLAILLLGVARVMDYVRAKRSVAEVRIDRDDNAS